MSLDLSWHPEEDKSSIFNERTWFVGTVLSAVAYGIVFTLFVLTFKQLIRTTTKDTYTQRIPFLIYITLMFILGTLYVASIAKMAELSFIDYRMFPGGPAAFQMKEFSNPINYLSVVSFVIANWLANGLLIYRYLVIFRSIPHLPLWVVMLIPVLAYMSSFALSMGWLIQISVAGSSPWINNSSHTTFNFTAPFFWSSLSLHILMTLAICARLLFYRKRVVSILGSNHGTRYTSVAAILVESAFLSSAFKLLFLIPFALNNPIQNTFIELLGEVQIIATLLIIYRVTHGAAWASETSKTLFGTTGIQNLGGVRVQVEFSGPHSDGKPLNRPSRSDQEQGGQYEMQKFTV